MLKFSEEKKRQHKVINVAEERSSGEDIKATKAKMFYSPTFVISMFQGISFWWG